MRYRALSIQVGKRHCGILFQYGQGFSAITRFVPDRAFWLDERAPVVAWAALQKTAKEREQLLAHADELAFFNGQGERLPAFFQNMLPEGPLRKHLEQVRGCQPGDHMEILAMCGEDLPGNIYAYPLPENREAMDEFVTQGHDALEMSVIEQPMAGATSLSGIQPKLGLLEKNGRYVARTRDGKGGVHIIAKLPTAEYALLPEVEELSLRLAAAAGVNTCEACLRPVSAILEKDQPFTVETGRDFLAVKRFDRTPKTHIHCEDFAQVLNVDPSEKYQDTEGRASYAAMLLAMREAMGLPEQELIEVLRRLMVNEMLGNYDAHLKNFGVIYADGFTPALSPAYDVVAYAAYLPGRGHALSFYPGAPERAQITPALIRGFCNFVGLHETKVRAALAQTVELARSKWPQMISDSAILQGQKERLMGHFNAVPAVQAQARRNNRAA